MRRTTRAGKRDVFSSFMRTIERGEKEICRGSIVRLSPSDIKWENKMFKVQRSLETNKLSRH